MADEQPENTPAGSYRVAGNDVSGYLGVDNEYMNYADETQKPSLTEEEAFLFLPVPVEVAEDESDEDAEAEDEDGEDADDKQSVTLTPQRPAL